MSGVPIVILDRDGTIFEDTYYPRRADEMRLGPRAGEALRLLQEKGYPLFVISNQSGVGRGLISDQEFIAVHERCLELLKAENVQIAEFGYCFHLPEDACSCRKPGTGLVPRSFEKKPVNLRKSYMVGDKTCDLDLADRIQATGYLVMTGHGPETYAALQTAGTLARYRICPTLFEMASEIPRAEERAV